MVLRTEELRRALDAAAHGDRAAESSLYTLLYEDLKELARTRRASMARHESLCTTELVHESWMRLHGATRPRFEDRRHFFGAAANAMRNVLVDEARRRSAQKRDVGRREELDEELPELVTEEHAGDVLALHLALEEFERSHPRPARVVVLRYFAGLSMEELAEVLGISLASAERDWRFGRAWLAHALDGGTAPGPRGPAAR